ILITIYFLGVKLQIMKFFTNVTPAGIIVAIIFVAFPMIGPMSRAVRVHFKETTESMFMQYYTIRGYDSKKALLKYGSRPALYGLFSIAISKFSSVLGGATVVEFAMALPGLSTFLIDSISRRDYPMVQSYIMILVIWMFLVNIVFEFIMGRILKREVSS
ncbi:MAG: ABC transporter permease subunit, partial [[Eubacterium] sulci]|nr:ABC transporter permease subunit [[Eubacterium] sulci]